MFDFARSTFDIDYSTCIVSRKTRASFTGCRATVKRVIEIVGADNGNYNNACSRVNCHGVISK